MTVFLKEADLSSSLVQCTNLNVLDENFDDAGLIGGVDEIVEGARTLPASKHSDATITSINTIRDNNSGFIVRFMVQGPYRGRLMCTMVYQLHA